MLVPEPVHVDAGVKLTPKHAAAVKIVDDPAAVQSLVVVPSHS
jgi:hypothetical protein